MTGPGLIRAMCPLTPKSSSRFRRCSAFWRSSSSLSVRRRSAGRRRLEEGHGRQLERGAGLGEAEDLLLRATAVRRARPLLARPGPVRRWPRPLLAPDAHPLRRALARPPARPAPEEARWRAPAASGAARRRQAGGAATRGRRGASRRPAAPAEPHERGQARDQRPREARVGRLGEAETGDRHEREEQDQPAHVAQGAAEHAAPRPSRATRPGGARRPASAPRAGPGAP